MSFTVTAGYAMVTMYFKKKRGLAVGLATMTGGLGAAIYAPLVTWLLNNYGYSGTMLVCGGLFLNLCVSGSLYRPLPGNSPLQRKTLNNANIELPQSQRQQQEEQEEVKEEEKVQQQQYWWTKQQQEQEKEEDGKGQQ